MRTKFKPWAEPFILSHPEISIAKENFSDIKDFYMEIGSGKGGFLLDMASKFPKEKFLGVEKNVTCAGISCKKIVESELPNIKFIWIDADILVKEIKDKSINGIFLNFSDPWPKKRHHKRRLTAPRFIDEYYRILKDDGFLAFKTDNKDLFEFSKEIIEISKFKIKELNENYLDEDPFDAVTEYEANFKEKGCPIYRMVLTK